VDVGPAVKPYVLPLSAEGDTYLGTIENLYGEGHTAYTTPFTPLAFDPFMAKVKDEFSPADQKAIAQVGTATLKPALDAIAAQGPITQEKLMGALKQKGLNGLGPWIVAPMLTVASDGALTGTLGGGIEFAHAGYPNVDPKVESAADLPTAVKLGRSYVRSEGGRWADPSDRDLLVGVQQLLASGADPSSFYKALMLVLTRTDVSGVPSLDDASRLVLGEILTVAQAEGDRFAETGEKQHSWQKDLEDAVLLGAYWAPAGGQMADFFGKGPSGSGIGETRQARTKLGQMLGKAEKARAPAVAKALEDAIGGANSSYGGNLLQQLVDYLNTTDPGTRTNVTKNAEQISEAATSYLKDIHDNATTLAKQGVETKLQ
jgi:hypothetical protein